MLLQSLLRPVLTPLMRGMFDAPLASATAWSPLDLPSLGAWFDPSDLSTMFQDAAGTTPVTAAGQPVGLILDKSGNGYHASQSTSTARPLFQVDGSGHCYLAFDGVDDYLNTASIDLTGTSHVTVFTGTYVNPSGVSLLLETSDNGFSNAGAFFISVNEWASNVGTFTGGGSAGTVNYTVSGQPAHAVTALHLNSVFTSGVGFATVAVNGVSQTVAVDFGNTSTGNFGNWPLHIGARILGGAAYFFNGNIYSLILGGAAYDAATVLAAEQWVADKSGVTL